MTKSQYADRDTVGTLALKARESHDSPEAGDMAREMMQGLVDDINEAITSDPFNGRPFYIVIHEKKDAQHTNMLLRRVIKTEKRPYPEPSTQVYWTDPTSGETKFCWALPHWSAFLNIEANPQNYHKETVESVKAWKAFKMEHFGFKVKGSEIFPDPNHQYKTLVSSV